MSKPPFSKKRRGKSVPTYPMSTTQSGSSSPTRRARKGRPKKPQRYVTGSEVADWASHKWGKDAYFKLSETDEGKKIWGEDLNEAALTILRREQATTNLTERNLRNLSTKWAYEKFNERTMTKSDLKVFSRYFEKRLLKGDTQEEAAARAERAVKKRRTSRSRRKKLKKKPYTLSRMSNASLEELTTEGLLERMSLLEQRKDEVVEEMQHLPQDAGMRRYRELNLERQRLEGELKRTDEVLQSLDTPEPELPEGPEELTHSEKVEKAVGGRREWSEEKQEAFLRKIAKQNLPTNLGGEPLSASDKALYEDLFVQAYHKEGTLDKADWWTRREMLRRKGVKFKGTEIAAIQGKKSMKILASSSSDARKKKSVRGLVDEGWAITGVEVDQSKKAQRSKQLTGHDTYIITLEEGVELPKRRRKKKAEKRKKEKTRQKIEYPDEVIGTLLNWQTSSIKKYGKGQGMAHPLVDEEATFAEARKLGLTKYDSDSNRWKLTKRGRKVLRQERKQSKKEMDKKILDVVKADKTGKTQKTVERVIAEQKVKKLKKETKRKTKSSKTHSSDIEDLKQAIAEDLDLPVDEITHDHIMDWRKAHDL